MNEKRLLLVAPDFPPKRGGVSDYSFKFYNQVRQEIPVELITAEEFPTWKGINLIRFFIRLCFSDCTHVLFQYTPYLYGKRGINFQLPLLIFIFSLFKRKKIEIMVHEYAYPFLGPFKSLLLNVSHRIMGRLLVLSCDKIFTSTIHLRERLASFSLCEVVHLPIGSNIKKTAGSTGVLEKLQVQEGQFLCVFGGFHLSKRMDIVVNSLKGLSSKVIHIGVTKDDYSNENCPLPSNVKPVGYLEENEISEIFSKARGSLIYYADGATTRRGSLMVAVEHGTPTITNQSRLTEKVLLSCPMLQFAQDEEEFYQMVRSLDSAPRESFTFVSPFTWPKIVSKYLAP